MVDPYVVMHDIKSCECMFDCVLKFPVPAAASREQPSDLLPALDRAPFRAMSPTFNPVEATIRRAGNGFRSSDNTNTCS
jgi:hypothetical protein